MTRTREKLRELEWKINFLHCCFSSIKRVANNVIIQINYSTYLNTTISDINLLNVFWLFVSGAISYAVPEKFAMNRVSRRCFPRYSNRGGRCIVSWRIYVERGRAIEGREQRKQRIVSFRGLPISGNSKNNLPTVVIGLPTGALYSANEREGRENGRREQ